MLRLKSKLERATAAAATAALGVSLFAPVLFSNVTNAAQVSNRYVKVSSSAPSATSVDYEIGFTPSATSFQSLVVEFCNAATGPIIGSTCTATAGTDTPQFTGAASPGTGGTGTVGGWSASTLSGNVIKLNGAANASSTAQAFKITGVTNPSATASFYARIYTYSNATYGTWAAGGAYGNGIDTGGMALSTATSISITAKVQETLTFCVSKANPTTGCGGLTAPNLALGHGANTILDSTAVDVDTAYFQVSTNASGNVIVRMKGSVLTSGANTIPTTPAGTNAVFAISAGTANFGMRVGTTGGTDYSATNVTIDSNYSHATSYGFDVTTATNNATSGYGDPIATVSASSDSFVKLNFGATASVTTPAGLYTATENLIATGTY